MIGRRSGWLPGVLFLCLAIHASAAADDAGQRVAILDGALPGMDGLVTEAVAESLRRSGLEVTKLSVDEACDPAVLSARKFFLYVIPNAKVYPGPGARALTQFLQSKGHLLLLGGSPFGNPTWKHQGRWIDQASMREAVGRIKPDRLRFTFDGAGAPSGWTHRGKADRHGSVEVASPGADGSAGCLKMEIHYESGTPDGWSAPLPGDLGVRGRGLLCFWAKGDGQTAQLGVRLAEGDGPQQRGIAVIRITRNWAYYVLRPEDFRQLGQANPARAKRVGFELIDRRLNPLVHEGRHTVYVDQLGVTPDPFSAAGDLNANPFPMIETISPGYKMFPLAEIAALRVRGGQAILDAGLRLPTPTSVSSCYRRPEGKGLERGYRWRWIPLVQALDSSGRERGTAMWMLLNNAPLAEGPDFEDAALRGAFRDVHRHLHQQSPAEGSIAACVAVADPAGLKAVAQTNLLGTLALRMRDGVFLSHAGSQEFSYWPGEDVRVGAVVANYGVRPASVGVRIRVTKAGGGRAVFERESALTVASGQKTTARFDWPSPHFDSDRYVVTTELLRDGRPIDRIVQEMGVLSTRKAACDEFITARDGEFWLRGKKWRPVGVNFWPRASIALESIDHTYHWLTPGFYDPEQVEQELSQLAGMGANLVCIRANWRNDRRTLLDFLRRCQNHGIYAFLFAQTHKITDEPHYFQGIMMPTCFQEQAVAEFVREARLADNPAIFAWDTIWEPAGWVFGGVSGAHGWREKTPYRDRWDTDWARWIDDRYGSLAAAEADWGMPVPRVNGRITSPSSDRFAKDGPWRVMMCAYRRFMDDLMSRKWNDATRKLRRIDPNHLISFRQGDLPPQDFTLTATPKHIDFFAMEGYSILPDHASRNAAGFINRYLHFLTRGKPFIWVEFGASVWDLGRMQVDPEKVARQAEVYETVCRAALENGANGVSPWWWGGGYRVAEQSDFGLLNPDGTLRPSAKLLRDYAPRFRMRAGRAPADTWITVDRDAHAGGNRDVAFHDGAKAYQAAAEAGQKLGIRTPATGTTSASVPLVAVGNTAYNGRNPPKYLDAEFNWFKVRVGAGPWIEVANGATIRVPRSEAIVAAASVGNLQEARWLTPEHCQGRPGAVDLASTAVSSLKLKQPIVKDTAWQADAEFGPSFPLCAGVTAATKVELQMTAEGRAWFGEKMRFTLIPTAAVP